MISNVAAQFGHKPFIHSDISPIFPLIFTTPKLRNLSSIFYPLALSRPRFEMEKGIGRSLLKMQNDRPTRSKTNRYMTRKRGTKLAG